MSTLSVSKARVRWTYDAYRTLPDDGNRYEVIDGELYVSPAPGTAHQRASKRIQTELILQLERTGIAIIYNAPVDVILSPTRTVQPDLLAIVMDRRGIITERGVEGPPDLVVEILSPSTIELDRNAKRNLYADSGVREYWLVDPATHRVEVLELSESGYTVYAAFGPGDSIRSSLFEIRLTIDTVFAP